MITRVLLGVAVVLGSSVVGAAPASADPNPNPSETHANPFGGLSSDSQGVPPALSPNQKADIEQGISAALAARVKNPQRS